MPRNTPLEPKDDPWRHPPPSYQTAKPGSILRLRVAPGVNPSDYGQCEAVYNISFATRNSRHEPSWGVTTVFIPADDTSTSSLLSYQPTYNTPNVDVAPSALLHRLKDHTWKYMLNNISDPLQRGWYVNFPDHEGPHAAFGNGLTHGHTVIDSIRAALQAGFGLHDNPRIALQGFSGGAFASAWAAELQPQYAPELRFHGACLGGLPADLDCAADLSGTPYAALVSVLLLGVTKEFPDARQYLLSELREEHKAEFLLIESLFVDESVRHFKDQDMWDRYFKNGRQSIMENPLMRQALNLTRLGYRGVPEAPIFIYKAIQDRNTPIEDTDELVKRLGAVGVNVRYERNTAGIHIQEAANGRDRAMDFLTAVFAGTYTHTGATVKDVTIDVLSSGEKTSFDPTALPKGQE